MGAFLQGIRGGLVVSCQARGDNPLSGADYMLAMAKAAQLG
ncbi:MAG: N-acylglucosamine-6-phosphate 2-epimerase, partial [Limnochordia bacterium]|nr:N-acylglucosamine-6-phosphate 2-epimerase [Limnochordia bacterium]